MLHSNRLEGAVPTSLGSCFALQRLVLGSNRLTSVPPTLSALQELQEINLSNMPTMRQEAPQCLGAMRALQKVWLQQSPFHGALPAAVGALPQLTHFGGEWCEFEGAVPKSFKASATIQHANLWRNRLLGRRGQRHAPRLAPLPPASGGGGGDWADQRDEDEQGSGGGGGGGAGGAKESEARAPTEALRTRLHRSPGAKAKLRKANARRSALRALSKERVAAPRPPPGPPPPGAFNGGFLNGRKLPVVRAPSGSASPAAPDWHRPVAAPAPLDNDDNPAFHRLMRLGESMRKLPPQPATQPQSSPEKQRGPDRAQAAMALLRRTSTLDEQPAGPSKLPSLR